MSSSRSSPTPSDRRLTVARVLGPKGLKGGVRIELLTDWPERLAADAEVYLDGEDVPMRITRVESGGRAVVLYLDRASNREAAEALTGRFLEAPAQPLPEGAYYWDELVGLRVVDPTGTDVGELVEIFRAGANEVYRIVGPTGERLVPALQSVVLEVDLARGVMTVAADDAEEVR
jgi:16S rRNA processing protein RimM